MVILHKLVEKKGMFYVEVDGNILAEMVYSMASPSKMIIEHTEVSDELKGKNVGFQLVKTAVDYARQNNIKIIPLCPFAKSVFDRKEELRDVLA
jgi:predicted GNAT family acetyltransferase